MSDEKKVVRVAVVQHEPCWFDLKGCVEKTINIITEAAQKGAKLLAFPEVWIPGYPAWIWARPADLDMFVRYFNSCMTQDSEYMKSICEAARANSIAVSLGYAEKVGGSIYLAQALINAEGKIVMNRRKIKPTHVERTVFAEGGGASLLNVVDVPNVGMVGNLCCWEHTQPLLKFHTHSQGEQIHVAAWPAQVPDEGRDIWSVAADGARALSTVYAVEGATFVLESHAVMSQKGVDAFGTADAGQYYKPSGGGSAVIGPDGRILKEGKYGIEEELIIADLDFDDITRAKALLDTHGHYSRPDLLWLTANTTDSLRVRRAE